MHGETIKKLHNLNCSKHPSINKHIS